MADQEPLRVGDVVHGHLNGYIDRDHYDCARVEAIGADWVVFRTFDGTAVVGTGAIASGELELARDEYGGEHSWEFPYG